MVQVGKYEEKKMDLESGECRRLIVGQVQLELVFWDVRR